MCWSISWIILANIFLKKCFIKILSDCPNLLELMVKGIRLLLLGNNLIQKTYSTYCQTSMYIWLKLNAKIFTVLSTITIYSNTCWILAYLRIDNTKLCVMSFDPILLSYFILEIYSAVMFIYIYIYIYIYRCPWCSCYRLRKWTRRDEFKSWTWLIAFHIALIPLEKVWIQLFSLQLWVNSRTD